MPEYRLNVNAKPRTVRVDADTPLLCSIVANPLAVFGPPVCRGPPPGRARSASGHPLLSREALQELARAVTHEVGGRPPGVFDVAVAPPAVFAQRTCFSML